MYREERFLVKEVSYILEKEKKRLDEWKIIGGTFSKSKRKTIESAASHLKTASRERASAISSELSRVHLEIFSRVSRPV